MSSNIITLIEKSDIEEAKKYIEKNVHCLQVRESHGMTPLHLAAKNGIDTLVKHIVQVGMKFEESHPGERVLNVNSLDEKGWTPLHWACHKEQLKICEYLLKETNCVVNVYDSRYNNSPLHLLTRITESKEPEKLLEVLTLIYSNGFDINATNHNGEVPLYLACLQGSNIIIGWLLSHRAQLNILTNGNETPLHAAIKNGNVSVIKVLLANGADPTLPRNGVTPIQLAQQMKMEETLELLNQFLEVKIEKENLSTIPDLSQYHTVLKQSDELGNPWGRSLLHQAVSLGNKEEVQWLLNSIILNDTALNLLDHPKGWPPVLYAAAHGHIDIILLLLKRGCNVDCVDSEGSSILHFVARNRILNEEYLGELLMLLRDAKYDFSSKNSYGFTPLHDAAIRNNTPFMKLLLNVSAATSEILNVLSSDGDTPLILATRAGHYDAVKMLIGFNADKTIKGKNGTALDIARCSNDLRIFKALLYEGYSDSNNHAHLTSLNILDFPENEEESDGNFYESEPTRDDRHSADFSKYNISHYIPLNLLVEEIYIQKLNVTNEHHNPLVGYNCILSIYPKTEKDREGVIFIWEDNITFIAKEDDYTFETEFQSVDEIEYSVFLLWPKIILNKGDMRLTLTGLEDAEAVNNLLQFLFKNKDIRPLRYLDRLFTGCIGAILFPKENDDLHRYPGLSPTETIIAFSHTKVNHTGRFARKFLYITRNRVVFGRNTLTGIAFEEIKTIKKVSDNGITVETAGASYVFTKIYKRDWFFQVLEYFWNLKQTDNRLLIVSSKGSKSDSIARNILKSLGGNDGVYARWVLFRGHHKPNIEEDKLIQECNFDIEYISIKDIQKSLLQMRKLVIIYLEYDQKLEEMFEEIIQANYKYIIFVTMEATSSYPKYQESVINMRIKIEQTRISFTCISVTPSLMQFFLGSFIDIKHEWQFRLPFLNKVSWLDEDDLIELVSSLMVCRNSNHYSKSYYLTGPEELSSHELANILSEVLNQETRFYPSSLEEMEKSLRDSKKKPMKPLELSKSSLDLSSSSFSPRKSIHSYKSDDMDDIETQIRWLQHASNNNMEIKNTLKDIINSNPRSFRQFVSKYKRHFLDDSLSHFSFEHQEILRSQFKDHADIIGHTMDFSKFSKLLGPFLTSLTHMFPLRFFKIFDREKSGKIRMADYISLLSVLHLGTENERVAISKLFFDHDEDGVIGINDLNKSNDMLVKVLDTVELFQSAQKIKSMLSPWNLKGFPVDENNAYKVILTDDEFKEVYTKNIRELSSLLMITQFKSESFGQENLKKGLMITPTHPQWELAISVSIGISKMLESFFPIVELSDKITDPLAYTSETTIPVSCGTLENSWTLTVIAPLVFNRIRNIYHVNPAQYLYSLGFEKFLVRLSLGTLSTYETVGSTGRSGSFIWKSSDQKFVLKSLPVEEFQFLKRNLQKFLDHYEKYPSTLISRFYGLYKIVSSKGETIFFVIMANVFDCLNIHEQYDLKGSTHNRCVGYKDWTSSLALKDMDFNRKIKIGNKKKSQLLEQIEIDAVWLESMNVCDYSLLVGVHYIESEDEVFDTNDISKFKKESGGMRYRYRNQVGNVIFVCGLIDTLTEFNFKKKGESAWKLIVHQGQISAISPSRYRKRFMRYMCTILE